MFKRTMIAICTVGMFSLGGLGTVETAEAARWGPVRRGAVLQRRYNQVQRDFRQSGRQLNRLDNQLHRHYRTAPVRRYYGPHYGYRGYRGGFVSTPYFSIGF